MYHCVYCTCSDDICQWSSNLYPCFVHRLIVPEGLWEIIGWGKQRAPAADEHSLTHSTGIHCTAGFAASHSRHHTALWCENIQTHWLVDSIYVTQLNLSIMFSFNDLFSPCLPWASQEIHYNVHRLMPVCWDLQDIRATSWPPGGNAEATWRGCTLLVLHQKTLQAPALNEATKDMCWSDNFAKFCLNVIKCIWWALQLTNDDLHWTSRIE